MTIPRGSGGLSEAISASVGFMRRTLGHAGHFLSSVTRKPVRFYAIVLATASLPLGLFLILAHEILVRQTTGRLVTQSSQSGRIVGNILEQHLQESNVVLESFARRRDLTRDVSGRRWDRSSSHLTEALALRPDFASFSIYDPAGVLRATHPPAQKNIGSDFADQEWFAGMRARADSYVSAVYASSLTKDHGWVIALSMPIRDERGKVVGYLVGEQTLENVTRKIYGLTTSNTATISFIDQQGRTFGRERRAGKDIVTVFQAPREVLDHIRKPSVPKGGTILPVAGKDHLVAYSPVPSLRWGILIQVPMAALQPALWAYEKNILLLALVILVFILAGSGFVASLYRRIEHQKEELALRNAEIGRVSQRKSRFLANMSHELRTPLNAILGFTELLQESGRLESKALRWNEHVRNAGIHLLQLVNDILDLSKIEAGELELHKESFSIEGAVPEVTAVLSPLARAKKISPEVTIEADLWLHADRVRFKQILYNLMSNAIKFTPEGGTVGVDAHASGQAVVLSVRDTGVGIAEEDHAAIFDEFEQVGEVSFSGQGTGLGLTITKKLVEQHGGVISVASERGKGSLFTLTLPRGHNPHGNAIFRTA